MYLRKLKSSDAPFMLEWMHDINVVNNLRGEFINKTIEDTKEFIDTSCYDNNNLHMAICSDDDEYMGTVSLKNIDKNSAEFAIAIRSRAMGKGYSIYAMNEIIKIGRRKGIEKIYWCVDPSNVRAVRFYDKHKFERIDGSSLNNIVKTGYSNEEIKRYYWYLSKF